MVCNTFFLSSSLSQFGRAVEMYRAAMTVWQEHESHDVECDRVQRIHTMENLAELLAKGHGRDTHTLRDDSLLEVAKQLRSEFMKRSRGAVKASEEAFVVCRRNVEEAKYEVCVCVCVCLTQAHWSVLVCALNSNFV